MGTHLSSMNKVSFEDVQWFIKGKSEKYLLINTLDIKDQCCLIKETIDIDREVTIINDHLNNKKIRIIIYGRNANDESIAKKYQQFLTLGFTQIYIYPGGLFEWLCLQDIYGYEKFPTRGKLLDILKFKPISQISGKYLLKNN
jgi:hypothetical protein